MSKLYIVPTPIGNLEDMTYRAVRILREVDTVLAEDTRTTGKLLKHYGIEARQHAHHQFNEHKAVHHLAERLVAGETMALVSDAGTPAVSDPGFLLIRECIRNNVEVECLPGAVAFIPALVNSGLPSERFIFEGFLPHKKGRKSRLEKLTENDCTMIFYESPYRLVKTLKQLAEHLGGERQASVSRELTKIHEENVRGALDELITHFENHGVKGEIVLVVAGK